MQRYFYVIKQIKAIGYKVEKTQVIDLPMAAILANFIDCSQWGRAANLLFCLNSKSVNRLYSFLLGFEVSYCDLSWVFYYDRSSKECHF